MWILYCTLQLELQIYCTCWAIQTVWIPFKWTLVASIHQYWVDMFAALAHATDSWSSITRLLDLTFSTLTTLTITISLTYTFWQVWIWNDLHKYYVNYLFDSSISRLCPLEMLEEWGGHFVNVYPIGTQKTSWSLVASSSYPISLSDQIMINLHSN